MSIAVVIASYLVWILRFFSPNRNDSFLPRSYANIQCFDPRWISFLFERYATSLDILWVNSDQRFQLPLFQKHAIFNMSSVLSYSFTRIGFLVRHVSLYIWYIVRVASSGDRWFCQCSGYWKINSKQTTLPSLACYSWKPVLCSHKTSLSTFLFNKKWDNHKQLLLQHQFQQLV